MTYDLSDTQDGHKCLRMGFIFCGKHLLMTRIQVSNQGPMGPLVHSIDGRKIEEDIWLACESYVHESDQEKVLCCRLRYYYTPRKLCGGYTVFTLSVRACVRPYRFVSLIS